MRAAGFRVSFSVGVGLCMAVCALDMFDLS